LTPSILSEQSLKPKKKKKEKKRKIRIIGISLFHSQRHSLCALTKSSCVANEPLWFLFHIFKALLITQLVRKKKKTNKQ
jgi:hypothetical protein